MKFMNLRKKNSTRSIPHATDIQNKHKEREGERTIPTLHLKSGGQANKESFVFL